MEFLAEHPAAELRAILDGARPLMDFVFEKRLAGVDLGVPGQRVAAAAEMARVLAPLKGSVLMPEYAERLAAALSMDVEDVKRSIREAPLPKDDDARPGARSRGAGQVRPGASARNAAASRQGEAARPSYDEVPPDAYDDYVPPEAYEDAPAAYAPEAASSPAPSFAPQLSAADRRQLSVEGELLCAMAERPDAVRPFADRLADVSWADSRHESMAWAMLSVPEGATSAEVVAAASSVEPRAPQLLSAGRVMGEEGMDDERKLGVVVDTLEALSCERRVRQIQGLMATAGEDRQRELLAEATGLQARANELRIHLSSSLQ